MDSSPLGDLLKSRIRQIGPMDVGEYMALCLGHPQYGYYMTRDPFGAAGDFTTAPEISQMFGEMIGMWCADLWVKLGSPKEFALVELGPGRGTLMDDILRTTKAMPGFHDAKKLYLMEMSPTLQALQNQKLGAYDPVWIGDLARLPTSIPVIIVANEFLDALPVRQLVGNSGAWRERVIGLDQNDTFTFGEKEVDPVLLTHLTPPLRKAEEEGVYEVSPILNHLIKSVDNLLKKQSGVALFLDYGHARSAMGDTLQAVKKHQYTNIFDTPGMCDLTAHVDFENVARIALGDGLAVHGPTIQGAFLKELGIDVRAERLKVNASEAQKVDLDSGLKRLIDTDQMGSLFKVLALCHDPQIDIAGFHERL